jgi:hypothetical protein
MGRIVLNFGKLQDAITKLREYEKLLEERDAMLKDAEEALSLQSGETIDELSALCLLARAMAQDQLAKLSSKRRHTERYRDELMHRIHPTNESYPVIIDAVEIKKCINAIYDDVIDAVQIAPIFPTSEEYRIWVGNEHGHYELDHARMNREHENGRMIDEIQKSLRDDREAIEHAFERVFSIFHNHIQAFDTIEGELAWLLKSEISSEQPFTLAGMGQAGMGMGQIAADIASAVIAVAKKINTVKPGDDTIGKFLAGNPS